MRFPRHYLLALCCALLAACEAEVATSTREDVTSDVPVNELQPLTEGPFNVAFTNMAVAEEYAGIGDEAMHDVLLGVSDDDGTPGSLWSVLEHPQSAFVSQVAVPDDPELYPQFTGQTYPVVSFIAYPTGADVSRDSYAFPYHEARYGEFENMLTPGESPVFADPEARYPLIILSHGMSAHAMFDVGHARKIASHGYIVVAMTYGDHRPNAQEEIGFLRPLITRQVLDDVLASPEFGPHIDANAIGISGFSLGGFTSLAVAGGRYKGETGSVVDPRIRAAVATAPFVGTGRFLGGWYAFGDKNQTLSNINIPVLTMYGTKDENCTPATILPATEQFSGPTYLVELVGQTHELEGGSWFDRDGWELLFFEAYLKGDAAALDTLRTATSMAGGNRDLQRMAYQRNLQ